MYFTGACTPDALILANERRSFFTILIPYTNQYCNSVKIGNDFFSISGHNQLRLIFYLTYVQYCITLKVHPILNREHGGYPRKHRQKIGTTKKITQHLV